MSCVIPSFTSRTHLTALPGWRAPASRRGALRDCSLLVPTCARRAEVERLLDALVANPDCPGEVVIVDSDPSRDLGGQLLSWRSLHPARFQLVYVASPPGLTRQRNVGLDVATGDYLFYLDPDIVPLPGYFEETRRVFESDRWGCVGGVAGVVVNEMRCGGSPRKEPLTYHASGSYVPASEFRPFCGVRRVDVLPGKACAWRREVFAHRRFSCYFGEWPEGEDLEISLRVGRSWTLLCCGAARVRQAASQPAAPGFAAGRTRMRNRYFVWRRHTPGPALRDAARFWIDSFRKVAAAARQPQYAAGLLAGICDCVKEPPSFVEPPARRQYVLESELRRGIAGD